MTMINKEYIKNAGRNWKYLRLENDEIIAELNQQLSLSIP